MSPRRKCTYHCGACDRHFHSLAAFDLHRQGDHGSNDPELGRHCCDPLDVLDKDGCMRLELWTEQGFCDIRRPRDGVRIWIQAGGRQREFFAAQRLLKAESVAA
jgi:hypothetical protein